jgi:hypothetical protein
MKRAGKCVGKVAFKKYTHALNRAKHWYKEGQIEYGIYECPTCLDFHLTSKYCNLQEYHLSWDRSLVKEQYDEFLRLERQIVNEPPTPAENKRRRQAEQRRRKKLKQLITSN